MKKIVLLVLCILLISVPAMGEDISKEQQNLKNSIEILKSLGAKIEGDAQSMQLVSEVNTNIIHFNESSFAVLDDENNIIKIDRIKETNEESFRGDYSHKGNYKETKTLIEHRLLKSGYGLAHSGNFDDTTVYLRYEKRMPYGGFDQYDAYDVYVDQDNGALVSFKKKGIEHEKISVKSFGENRKIISKESAMEIANNFLKQYNKKTVKQIRISTAIPNQDFFRLIKGEPETKPEIVTEENIKDKLIKKVYILSNDDMEVYVDIYTGEIIGGGIYLASAGAISVSDKEIPYPVHSIIDASAGLSKMGYTITGTAIGENVNFRRKARAMLPTRAFYVNGHANSSEIGSLAGKSFLTTSDIPNGNYQFVFLDGCNTGSTSTWASAFGIYNGAYGKRAFLGWFEPVNGYMTHDYMKQFWICTSLYKPVRQAALEAADLIPQYCPIRFYGNKTYCGYS